MDYRDLVKICIVFFAVSLVAVFAISRMQSHAPTDDLQRSTQELTRALQKFSIGNSKFVTDPQELKEAEKLIDTLAQDPNVMGNPGERREIELAQQYEKLLKTLKR